MGRARRRPPLTMTRATEPPAGSGTARPLPVRDESFAERFASAMRDTSRRNIYFSAASIPGHLAMAAWKGILLVVSVSLFMAANVAFTLGLALVKFLVVTAAGQDRAETARRRVYRLCGGIVLTLALAYAVCCIPLALGLTSAERYSPTVSIAIATVAFSELGFSIHGFVSARRHRDLLMEAVKLSNLAASLILLVLAQTALLSTSATEDHSVYDGVCGIVMGLGAAAVGLHMILHRFSR